MRYNANKNAFFIFFGIIYFILLYFYQKTFNAE